MVESLNKLRILERLKKIRTEFPAVYLNILEKRCIAKPQEYKSQRVGPTEVHQQDFSFNQTQALSFV